jgi:hypothetical protein
MDRYNGVKKQIAKVRDLCNAILFAKEPEEVEELLRRLNLKHGDAQEEFNGVVVREGHGDY